MVLEPASIRSLLIRAWRERWSDIQWGIHIKTVLPRYISGDIYQLSDCILQQALMGSLPNNLILSYLHHSLASQIVSFGGVIESISKYDGFNKPYCIQALLNLMQSMMKNVNCKGKSEDCLMLATSLLAGIKWLVQVMNVAVEKLVELQTAPEHSTNLKLASSVLHDVVKSPFLICLFHIGCKNDSAVWNDCKKKINQLQTDITSGAVTVENMDTILITLRELQDTKPSSLIPVNVKYDATKIPFCHAVFTLVMLEVLNHTTREAKVITKQLLLLKKFKGLTVSDLYFEVLRACFIGMSAPEFKKYQALKWVGFTYIKLPIIIHSIHTTLHGDSCSFSSELLEAVQKISEMTPLLDVADHRIKCNCLEYLFKELTPKVAQASQTNQTPSLDLLTERDAQTILAKRMQESNVLHLLKNNDSKGLPLSSPDLILRAYPTVIGILKTLTNKKNMDSVMSVLSLLISGKSRELLLIAATSSGRLHIYAQKFVRLNEQSKEPVVGETPSVAASRGLVFDISFLLLCHIAQIYGIEVVVSDKCDTFIEQWILDNIPEVGKIKTVLSPSEVAETAIIEDFFRQINATDSDKYSKANFADLCRLSALSMRELISAAFHGQVLKQMIFDLLSKFCYHLCSLPICVTAWLCSYMQQVDGEEALLAQEFLHYMQNKILTYNNSSSSLETFKDRSNLMSEIIDNMADFISKPMNYAKVSPSGPSMNMPTPLPDIMAQVWLEIKNSNGVLTHKALSMSKDLLRLGGVRWFVTNFVKSSLNNVFEKELMTSLDVVYGIFHLDIVNCTLNHIIFTLPNYISGSFSGFLSCEPRTSALGRLTAMLLVECWATIQRESSAQITETPSTAPPQDFQGSTTQTSDFQATTTTATPPTSPISSKRRGEKRSFSQRQMEELQERFLATEPNINLGSLGNENDVTFFLAAVHHLFALMLQVSRSATVSPVTHLIVFTLKELVSLPHSSTLLSLLHPSLLNNLLPLLSPPVTFDYPQLLSLSAPDVHEGDTAPMPLDILAQSARKEKEVNQASAKLLCVKRNLELFG